MQPNGRFKFVLNATVKRRDEKVIRELFDDVERYLRTDSIYRGSAVKVRFLHDNGKMLEMPDVKFLNAKSVDPQSVIFSRELEEQINVNLFIPITRVEDCIRNRVAVKRGILLGGTYGTGKTMAASVASRLAVDNGVTYVYTPRANELKLAIEFAKQYQSPACVVFCEDVDRVTDGKRGVELDDLLNIIDGIDTKQSNIITVLTTNMLDNVNPAMLRPGRLDAVIELQAPDAEAVERLVRHFGGNVIAANEDLTEVGAVLAGQIPAMVSEVVKRAKLYQIGLQDPGTEVRMIESDALLYAAKTMRSQLTLLERRTAEQQIKPPTLDDKFREVMGEVMANGGGKAVAKEIIKVARQ
jgi:transitional endoplasmic reticulum ATPase